MQQCEPASSRAWLDRARLQPHMAGRRSCISVRPPPAPAMHGAGYARSQATCAVKPCTSGDEAVLHRPLIQFSFCCSGFCSCCLSTALGLPQDSLIHSAQVLDEFRRIEHLQIGNIAPLEEIFQVLHLRFCQSVCKHWHQDNLRLELLLSQ